MLHLFGGRHRGVWLLRRAWSANGLNAIALQCNFHLNHLWRRVSLGVILLRFRPDCRLESGQLTASVDYEIDAGAQGVRSPDSLILVAE